VKRGVTRPYTSVRRENSRSESITPFRAQRAVIAAVASIEQEIAAQVAAAEKARAAANPFKFTEAARRVILLLRLAEEEQEAAAKAKDAPAVAAAPGETAAGNEVAVPAGAPAPR
jgi:hypothetical protein